MSKVKMMVMTVGIITGIIGILTGCAELLHGSLLIETHSITALPVDWPNPEFYLKMRGGPVFSVLTGIPYFVVGLMAIIVSITLIVYLVAAFEITKVGIAIFSVLNIAIFCFGASESIPVVEGLPAIVVSILALKLKKKERTSSRIRKLHALFRLFYWWNIFSWVLFFPVIFLLSFYQEIPQPLFLFMGMSMPFATSAALVAALMCDLSIPITNEA